MREHELQLEEYKADLTYRIRRTEELYTETNRYINGRMDDTSKNFDEVYRQMDSRLDRLTNKMRNPVKKDLLQD